MPQFEMHFAHVLKQTVRICGEAKDGRAAIAAAAKLHPDVVILDISMPVMNGIEAARALTTLSPKPEVVLFTAHDSDILQEDLQSLGVKTVISKNDRHMVKQLKESVLRPSASGGTIAC
jgi:DNA-binding NarL/FixJ family response regulator